MSIRYGNMWMATSTDSSISTTNAGEMVFDNANSLFISTYGGNDQIYLGGGWDNVWAGAGHDTIVFNARNQHGQVSGQGDADTFIIKDSFSGHMTISDFSSAQGDHISFEKGVVNWHQESLSGGRFGMVHEFADGSSVTVVGQSYWSLYQDMAHGFIA
ncbi:hypothetical protein GJW-30_1_03023 [Variibacter gotjawalensis]|uniref:Uncharacterized protein n=1 Tax=Variibacter gotjawalensis TaxID=1333996 RepID=A0A0S3PX40_9BRAD|nr:hypothetical protein [Variibacter gotjawalensis]NIK46307.1 Ca2+-binding RTX toxin-like protein [Variibacter gotjawalensis]RZS48222.1 hypothetical protein EV661_0626 [Variibacter gotjawalensis]BAT60479.1 hypothetical protein GJW-30_1_03023 [Variibacter gotjawalensis]